MPRRRFNILGVRMNFLNLGNAVAAILDFLKNETARGYVCVTNTHGIVEAQDDPELKRIFNRSFLTVPDGMPTVWIGRFIYGDPDMGRVYGPELMWELFAATEGSGIRHFFYGGQEGVAEELRQAMLRAFPESEIVGTYFPPFRPLEAEEERDLTAQLERCRPDIMWVGLSTPKQDRFMGRYAGKLPVRLMFGVGAAFDFHTGRVPQAPRWIQRGGLEWLFRLIQEPKRLWHRYSRCNTRFLWLYLLQVIGARKFPAA